MNIKLIILKKKVALDRTLETVMKPLPDFYPLVCLVT